MPNKRPIFPKKIVEEARKLYEDWSHPNWKRVYKDYNKLWISKCGQFVAKFQYCTAKLPKIIPVIPTLVINGQIGYDLSPFVLQRRADRKQFKFFKAHRELKRKYSKQMDLVDGHPGNCAYYKGRAVLIDW